MATVEIYTWQDCPYCRRALEILQAHSIEYIQHAIDGNDAARAAMSKRANGRRSVPQVFVDNELIGGCSDLLELERAGQLEVMLGKSE